MDPATLAMMIPLAPFILGGIVVVTRHQRKIVEIRAQATAEKAAQYAAHTERLEERVRVLERILTDRGTSLAHEIDALRVDDVAEAPGKKLQ